MDGLNKIFLANISVIINLDKKYVGEYIRHYHLSA
ncbi:unnamed protein product [Acanthoscelides obtectus]|uniref:Uncharacterized protein n=1 Tax=Acanthoscelides obtectus TaxID=200917 RepID=A0A9P0NT61_ACAOB|nr:unnamed protein product [Acanthoscelides obtectus]CAK1625805.1 hypothetical protein AOBTE_LOCUS3411 [Acanthoscelides obtectus]